MAGRVGSGQRCCLTARDGVRQATKFSCRRIWRRLTGWWAYSVTLSVLRFRSRQASQTRTAHVRHASKSPGLRQARIHAPRLRQRANPPMTEQLALTLAASVVGVLSAVFFAIGNAFNSTKKIIDQSGTWWDFNESLARSLAAQRAQYVTGGLLLLAAFGLQVLAALASSTNAANLPQWLDTWQRLVPAVLLPLGLVSWLGCATLERITIRKVLRAHSTRAKQEK